MNYLSELIFGKNTEPWENIPEAKVIGKYCLYYSPYKFENMNEINQNQECLIKGIINNETFYSSTFPDFNEKIFDTEHYEKVIYDLEQKYTNFAKTNFAKTNNPINNNIEIIKRIYPETFKYNNKDYDLSRYEFVIILTEKNKNT